MTLNKIAICCAVFNICQSARKLIFAITIIIDFWPLLISCVLLVFKSRPLTKNLFPAINNANLLNSYKAIIPFQKWLEWHHQQIAIFWFPKFIR